MARTGLNYGIHTYRFADNPEEKRFAEAWATQNGYTSPCTLAYLLDPKLGTGRPPEPTLNDRRVAATVIQWLGSPVGQDWLRGLGYERQVPKAPAKRGRK